MVQNQVAMSIFRPTRIDLSGTTGKIDLSTQASGVLPVENTSIPHQIGNAGKFLMTDGNQMFWMSVFPDPPSGMEEARIYLDGGEF